MNIDFKPFILVSSRSAKGAKYARGTTRGAGGTVSTILRRSKCVLERSTTGGEGETEESEVLEVKKEKGKEVEEEEVEEVLISSQSQRNLSQQPFRNQLSLPSTRQSSPSRRSSTQQSQPSPSTI